MSINLDESFKAYDVRGIVGETITHETVRATGAAFTDVLGLAGQTVLVGGDMRPSSPEFMDEFAQGARARGANVVKVGLISTDELYFACGVFDAAGVTFTASHNPAEYNGMKMSQAGAVPVSSETGLYEIRNLAQSYLSEGIPSGEDQGSVEERDILTDYANYLRGLVDLTTIRPLKVVVDAGNGMAGKTTPAVLGDAVLPGLPLDIVPMYFDLDGTFPNHPANPLEPANLRDLQAAVVREGADIGLAFDGDADRCFVIDERGHRVDPSVLTALIGLRESRRVRAHGEQPVVLHNLITSRFVPEVLARDGVRTVRTRVGHSFIKTLMASENAVFGGEHSGHYYFRDFFGADSGLLAAMHVLSALATDTRPLSVVAGELDPYSRSGEIDLPVQDVEAAQRALIDGFRADDPASGLELDTLDGVMISHWDDDIASADRWWLSIRPSNTEPLLRLNIEAASTEAVHARREKALAALRRH